MAFWLCQQPNSVEDISVTHRIIIYLIGIFEAITWSGCIFGWPQMLQVLKMNGIYSHLCETNVKGFLFSNVTSQDQLQNDMTLNSPVYLHCPAQDERYALIYTVSCVLYSAPGILNGYSLHHFGLAATRVAAGLMMMGGFLCLSAITIESPDYLWGGAILISISGNTIRMSGLQFGSLFPKHCATATSVISGIFSASAAVFILFTYGSSAGLSWQSMCYIYAFAASFILVATVIIPLKHIPYAKVPVGSNLDEESRGKTSKEDTALKVKISSANRKVNPEKEQGISLLVSLFSYSNILFIYWYSINMVSVTIFTAFFNSWIHRISQNSEEALYYSRLFGYANMLCVFFSFLPGFVIGLMTKTFQKDSSGLCAHVAKVQALSLPKALVSITATIQISCLLFNQSWAVYLALLCLAITKPACNGVGMPFLRLRFPENHFNRLVGLQGTLTSALTMLQYAHFVWAQIHFYPAMISVIIFLLLGLCNPMHLLNKNYITKSLKGHGLNGT